MVAAEALTPQERPQVLLASSLLSSVAVVGVAVTSSLLEVVTSAGAVVAALHHLHLIMEMEHFLAMVK